MARHHDNSTKKKYIGSFVKGQYHTDITSSESNSTLYNEDEDEIYWGQFKYGKYDGLGAEIVNPSIEWYYGKFTDGKRNGLIKRYWKEGDEHFFWGKKTPDDNVCIKFEIMPFNRKWYEFNNGKEKSMWRHVPPTTKLLNFAAIMNIRQSIE